MYDLINLSESTINRIEAIEKHFDHWIENSAHVPACLREYLLHVYISIQRIQSPHFEMYKM